MVAISARVRGEWSMSVVAAAVLLIAAEILRAQVPTDWRRLPMPQNRYQPAFAVDPGSGALVVHSGMPSAMARSYFADSWLWIGGHWQQSTEWCTWVGRPPAGARQPLLADPAHNRLLLVGFQDYSWPNPVRYQSVWQFESGCWSPLWGTTNTNAAPDTLLSCFAFDEVRDCIVAFGTSDPWMPGNQTWEWNGSAWNLRAPANAPSQRSGAALGYDRARQRTVLFGGAVQNDTWQWDGSNWQQVASAVAPAARSGAQLVYDAANTRLLLVGGVDQQGSLLTDIWSCDGSGWTQVAASGVPARQGAGFAFDNRRQRLLLMGGSADGVATSELWAWDGVSWQQLDATAAPLAATVVTDLAQGKVLCIDDRCRVWQRQSAGWAVVPAAGVVPPARWSAAVAFDMARGRTVLFGGETSLFTQLGDTWEWSGSGWTLAQPLQNPAPRAGAAMASDVAGGLLMFGGRTPAGFIDETWRWDGSTWTLLQPATAPSPRRDSRMVLDPIRRVVLLIGGYDSGGRLFDPWEWNGVQWRRAMSATWPPSDIVLPTFDHARGVVSACVLVPGHMQPFPPTTSVTEIWDWDGVNWQLVDRMIPNMQSWPMGYIEPEAYGYDPQAGRCVAIDADFEYGGTFEFGPVQVKAATRDLGPGCASPQASLWVEALYLGESSPVSMQGPNGMAAPAFLLLGLSDANWNGMPLPFDLGSAGAPGCRLLAAPDVVVLAGETSYGFGPVAYLQPCLCPQFAGVRLFLQGAYLWPQANAAGLLLTNGCELKLGLR